MTNEMMTNGNAEEQNVVAYHKRDYALLPKAEAVSIRPAGNVKDGENVKVNAYVLMVKCVCNGKSEWRLENEWMHYAGLKSKARAYVDTKKNGVVLTRGIDKAKAAKEDILSKWGVEKAKKERKAKAVDLGALVANMTQEQKDELMKKLMAA